MSKTVVISNQKGGVGKTTTAINLAYELTRLNRRILLVDIDPQSNSTSGLGIDKEEIVEQNLYQAISNNKSVEECIIKTNFEHLDLLPGHEDLSGGQVEMVGIENREHLLKSCLKEINEKYEYILIDTPPSLGYLTINAFCAAESILIPIQCEYFALEGLTQLFKTIKQIKSIYNPNIYIEGIVLTMYDSRTKLSREVVENVQAHFKEYVYQTVIIRNVKISESPSHGLPIGVYAKNSSGASGYRKLAKEFIRKNESK